MNEEMNEPCPVCTVVGGYCGGSGHPSCGAFRDGRPISAAVADAPASRGHQLMGARLALWAWVAALIAAVAIALVSGLEVLTLVATDGEWHVASSPEGLALLCFGAGALVVLLTGLARK